MLLGTVGEQTNGLPPNYPGEHSRIEKQCTACHMQTSPFAGAQQPAITGHSFTMTNYAVCTPCHGPAAQGLAGLVQNIVTNEVSSVTASLRLWATTQAPAQLQTLYGTNAWEYTSPGGLSTGGPGPTNAAQQALIPVNIQKARFNLYLVFNDGSLGIHNPFYALNLLDAANFWVQEELNAPVQ